MGPHTFVLQGLSLHALACNNKVVMGTRSSAAPGSKLAVTCYPHVTINCLVLAQVKAEVGGRAPGEPLCMGGLPPEEVLAEAVGILLSTTMWFPQRVGPNWAELVQLD